MKLSDLTKRVTTMTTEELLAHVKGIRHERDTVRPSSKKRKDDVEKVETRRKGAKAKKGIAGVLAGLSDAEREALIKQLEGGE